MTVKFKEIKILKDLIGRKLPPYQFGQAGRAFEDIMEEDYGVQVNRSTGVDDPRFKIEYKTRDLDAVSPQTVATMSVEEIIATPYYQSAIFKKFQQQIRIKTRNMTIVEAELYDFSPKQIQEVIGRAYEHARAQLTANPSLIRTASGNEGTGYWGYFEATNKSSPNSRSFRINPNAMDDYEDMATSTFNNIFEYGE